MNSQPIDKNIQPSSARKPRRFLGCLGRGAMILAGLLVLTLVAGVIFQAAAGARDLRKYPATGQLYDVGDYSLRLNCTGEGSPTVILETGAGTSGLTWIYVQEEIEKSTRVCSYDRAGIGWSEPAANSLSPQQVASDLHALLGAAGVPGPYVLVGHSAGGVYIRAYTSQYPSEVAGMVLVDSSHEGQAVRYPPEWQRLDQTQNSMMAFCKVVSPFGLMRLSHIFDAAFTFRDSEVKAAFLTTLYRTSYCRVSADEIAALAESYNEPDIPGSLDDLPLIVLTADSTEEEMQAQIPAYLSSVISPEVIRKVFQVNREMQADLAGLSSRGKQIMVPNTGHMIPLDQPGVVIDAIRDVLGQVVE
jgi:pimeloyl-ACP methyl ester carboxylesterase